MFFLWDGWQGKWKVCKETQPTEQERKKEKKKERERKKKERKITHASTLKLEMNVRNLSYFTNCITFPVCMEQSNQ